MPSDLSSCLASPRTSYRTTYIRRQSLPPLRNPRTRRAHTCLACAILLQQVLQQVWRARRMRVLPTNACTLEGACPRLLVLSGCGTSQTTAAIARASCSAGAPRRAPPSCTAGTLAESLRQHHPGAHDFAVNRFATWRLHAATFSCKLALRRCTAGSTPAWKLAAVQRGTPRYSPRWCSRLRRRQLVERRS